MRNECIGQGVRVVGGVFRTFDLHKARAVFFLVQFNLSVGAVNVTDQIHASAV